MTNPKPDFARMLQSYLPDASAMDEKALQDEVGGAPAGSLKKLPIEARVDLHGLTLAQALRTVDSFLKESATRGLRKVLIIHGKGNGILKAGVARYLEAHPLAGMREIAPRAEGGSGALVICLKAGK